MKKTLSLIAAVVVAGMVAFLVGCTPPGSLPLTAPTHAGMRPVDVGGPSSSQGPLPTPNP